MLRLFCLVMRLLLGCFALFYTCICATGTDAEPLQSLIDAYLAEVGSIMMPAIEPEIPWDAPRVDEITISFQIDPEGKPTDLKVASTPANKSLEEGFTRAISRLHFPPVPARILKEGGYKFIEFRTKLHPKREKV